MNEKFLEIGFYKIEDKVLFNEGLFTKYFLNTYDLIYCNQTFYIYDGNFWKSLSDLELKKIAKNCFDTIEEGAWRLSFENKYFPAIKVDVKKVDEPTLNRFPYKLNFLNGVWNFKERIFEKDCKENYFTYSLDYGLYERDDCQTPYFDSLIETLSNGDEELSNFLLQLASYLISGNKTEQRFFLLKSSGNSGKSTFINLLVKLLTQNFVSSISLSQLDDRFALSDAVGKKLIVAAENENNQKIALSSETLKKLCGDDLLRIEKKYKEAYSAYLNVELLFSTNSDELSFADVSDGLKRRITIIETRGTVKNPIVDFDKKLEDEIPFIMYKLINVYEDIRANKFKLELCDSVVQSTTKFIENLSNTTVDDKIGEDFLDFFEENLDYSKDSITSKKAIYNLYCNKGGKESATKFWLRFDKWVKYKKYEVKKTNPPNRSIDGIRIISKPTIINKSLNDLF